MYRLMIVDDEWPTRNGIRVCIDWSKYGIEVVGEASSGAQGLELAKTLQPGIVLTDVRMPGMDGIEMVSRLREQNEEIKIIFISGFDDLDYLKSAIRMDAIDYILKPVNLEELEEAIQRVLDQTKKRESEQELLQHMHARLYESLPLLRERFLVQLISKQKRELDVLRRRIEFLELPLPVQGEFVVLVLSIDNLAAVLDTMNGRDVELLSFSTQNIVRELVSSSFSCSFVFEHAKGEFVILLGLSGEDEQEAIFPLLTEVKQKLDDFFRRFHPISLTIGVGSTVKSLNELNDSYTLAVEAGRQKLFLGKNKIITIDELAEGKDMDLRYLQERMNALVSLLKTGNTERISAGVESLFREMAECRGGSPRFFQMLCLQALSVTSQFMMEFGIMVPEVLNREKHVWEQLYLAETLEEMQQLLEEYLHAVCLSVGDKRFRKTNDVIDRVQRIVRERYTENLTISQIAEEVFLSSTYLCLLFKQETGETINDYLTGIRMEAAKELLSSSDLKLSEVSFQIGYAEPGYFSKQFRKHTGMSPREYRDIHFR